MNDLDLFKLSEEFTLEDLKRAFRIKSKQFHPDRNKDSLNSHLMMIRVNQAYSNLITQLGSQGRPRKESGSESPKADQVYSVYKSAIDKFREIHPSKWKKVNKTGIFNPDAVETNPDTPRIIQSLIELMAEAYYGFSTIVNEYPESCWYTDSLRKLKDIEKMTVRYGKILESYQQELIDSGAVND